MENSDEAASPGLLFPKNCNLVLVVDKETQKLIRYLGEDEARAYVVDLGSTKDDVLNLNRAPNTKRNRFVLPIEHLRALRERKMVWRVSERGIPPEMNSFVASGDAEANLKSKTDVVEHIVSAHGDAAFKNRKVYATAVSDAATKYNLSEKTVRQYYERYLFYGEHKFALIDHDWEKGGPGIERRGARHEDGTRIDAGRKTYAQLINPQTKLTRVQVTARMHARFSNFVQREANAPGAKLTAIVRRFLAGMRISNRGADGEKRSFPISPVKLPSEDNLKKIGRPLFKQERARMAVLRSSAKGKSYSAKIANGDLNVVDIDGTVADCFLRVGDSVVAINGVLKPTVLLAIDRSSRAIVGWYVTYRPEDGDSYLACLFSVCTDKEEDLARWDLAHLNGMVFGCPSAIFVDRGSGISEKVRRAVVKLMRLRLLMARPGEGKAKGDVEQLMSFFQDEIAHLPGVTHGEVVNGTATEKEEARKRNRNKLRKAPAGATLTLRDFMRALLTAISRYNLQADMRRLRNSVMLEANVPPVPKHMFQFNMAMREGDAAWELTEEDVIRRLAKPFKTVAPGGVVTLQKKEFTSFELRRRAVEYEAIHGQSMPVAGYELFTSQLHAIWDDNGYFEELEATKLTLSKFGVSIPDIRDYFQFRDLSDLGDQLLKTRDHPTVDQAVKRGGVSQATKKQMDAVEGLPLEVNSRRARRTAVAHTGAADTRAILAKVNRSARTASDEVRVAADGLTHHVAEDASEIDIDF
ncbi:transposase [Pararobbsia alpina]|uniref:hypothetical protein n=1 Tax=Pararobbsia alpina TaxID=621374 RepID=UPI0039A46325